MMRAFRLSTFPEKKSDRWQVFTLTFLAEWGDRSQISTIVLAAQRNPYAVALGGILGHAVYACPLFLFFCFVGACNAKFRLVTCFPSCLMMCQGVHRWSSHRRTPTGTTNLRADGHVHWRHHIPPVCSVASVYRST